MNKVIWADDHNCQIDEIRFRVETGNALYNALPEEENTFIIGKSRRMIEVLLNLEFINDVKNICEIGIYKGGSVVFYHKLFNPAKIVAFDLQKDPPAPLERYIKNNALESVIKTHYEVDQADQGLVEGLTAKDIGDDFYDIVIDDASHLLRPTRASFNSLFPKLRRGGYYLIEDWGWAHWNRSEWQENGGPWKEQQPLSNLIFEITMLMASRPDLIESIRLLPAYAVIRKGAAANLCRNSEFDISQMILNRGNPVTLLS